MHTLKIYLQIFKEFLLAGLPTVVIREKILQGQRPWLPSQLPAQLVALIERCWERNPDRRPNFNFICFTLKHIKASLLKGKRPNFFR